MGLTSERLREVAEYDPETGVFRAKPGRQGIKPGGIMGVPKNGYLAMYIDGGRYYAHRLAWLYMTGEWPPLGIDHANRDRSDNRWANLRPASQSLNLANASLRSDNTTGFRGVIRLGDKFCAQIRHNRKNRRLGTYRTAAAAAAAYDRAAEITFGEYAYSNLGEVSC